MRTSSWLLLPLPLLLTATCSSTTTTRGATAPPLTVAAVAAPAVVPGVVVPATAPVPASPSTAALTDAAVRTVVEQWLAAQNTGNFVRYEGLYAERFNGTKRVSAVVRTYDRVGWINDRERMFTAPMQVTAADVAKRLRCIRAVRLVN